MAPALPAAIAGAWAWAGGAVFVFLGAHPTIENRSTAATACLLAEIILAAPSRAPCPAAERYAVESHWKRIQGDVTRKLYPAPVVIVRQPRHCVVEECGK